LSSQDTNFTSRAQPPANSFVKPGENDIQATYPLDVYFCKDCTHLQLMDVVNPEILFRNYVYVSGTSLVMRSHLQQYAHDVVKFGLAAPGEFVVEFGSNDGTLLHLFKDLGFKILGVDPARNLAAAASEAGIPTIPEFFNKDTALQIVKDHGKAKIVCANHCCAHIDDFLGIVEGVKTVLQSDGYWIFEVGYLLDVYQKGLFDTIYHEHVDFHTVRPLITCLSRNGMKLLHVTRSSIQGGAIRCFVGFDNQQAHSKFLSIESVQELLHAESAAGLDKEFVFRNWHKSIQQTGLEIRSLLRGIHKAVVGYGAPAKATTLMYTFGLTRTDICYIVDDNELKQGLLTPGLHIPVVNPSKMYEDMPEYVIILAWNFADFIIEQHSAFLKSGGRFIVPLPSLRIVKH